MRGVHFFCEIRAGAKIFTGVKVFCYTGSEFFGSLHVAESHAKTLKVLCMGQIFTCDLVTCLVPFTPYKHVGNFLRHFNAFKLKIKA